MNSEWPIRAEAGRRRPVLEPTVRAQIVPRLHAAAKRLANATIDLSLDDADRISDRVRASVATMRDGVLSGIERTMRSTLLPRFADAHEIGASLSSPSVALALPLLEAAGTLAHPPFVAVLLRRAEESVMARRILAASDGSGLPVDDVDPEIAEAATTLLVAQARGTDRFGEPALLFDDLPAELAAWAVWQVAAALGHYLCEHHHVDAAYADASMIAVAATLLRDHDEGRGLRAGAARLAAKLAAAGRLDGALLETLVRGGEVAAFAAALAAAVALPEEDTGHLVLDPTDGRLATALRAADIPRDAAAAILLHLIPPGGDSAVEIAFFDAGDPLEAAAALLPLAMPADYRAAVRTLNAALAGTGTVA